MTTAVQTSKSTGRAGHRDTRVGKVVSDKGDKTITVQCDFSVKHPKYGKFMRRRTKLRAHDENNDARQGDRVEVVSCRRLSKSKCWRLTRVVKRGSSDISAVS